MIYSDIIPDYILRDIPNDGYDNDASHSYSNGSSDERNGDMMFMIMMIMMLQ